ncbi:hypothetical protein U8607_15230 [Methylobacterium durans]|uniref:hypothetical protein n=1 Tax=Methylobacterium durans TaxID=2202825 RepID=UPI002AFF4BE8|nr:hypothetical protein [Methylobacterium durans]MEA1833436.1 hypothetical protein [Methylobacterium durans]
MSDKYDDLSTGAVISMVLAGLRELAERGMIKSPKDLVGGLGEYLICRAMGWQHEPSTAYDARSGETRIQIKSRTSKHWPRRAVSTGDVRDLDNTKPPFELFAVVVFNDELEVTGAFVIPADLAMRPSDMKRRKNGQTGQYRDSWVYTLRPAIRDLPEVDDVTKQVQEAHRQLCEAPTPAQIAMLRTKVIAHFGEDVWAQRQEYFGWAF